MRRSGLPSGTVGGMSIFILLLGLPAVASVCWAVSYYLSVDVPATLGGFDHTPDEILLSDNAVYTIALPPAGEGLRVSALHRRPDGIWLVVMADPYYLGLTEVMPHDITSSDGAVSALYFDGGAAGIPDDVRIDALFLDAGGDLILSFDVPVSLGGADYSPSDLVRFAAGVPTLLWDAEAAGVPAGANVVGADRDSAGVLVVGFDVPVILGGAAYLPGQLVRCNEGGGFSSYFVDGAWPPYAQLRDFAFVPAAGVVPDGGSVPGTPLTVSSAAGNLTLAWGASCGLGDTDYEIYEGTLGSYYSHGRKLCSTGGVTTATFPLPTGSTYYLVVPKNGTSEGSYGLASNGSEVPRGIPSCLPQQIALVCP